MTIKELWNFSQGDFDLGNKLTDTEWKYKVEDKTLYIAFNHSVSSKDYIHNFLFLPRLMKPYKGMKTKWLAHSGFVLKWKSIEDQVEEKLRPYWYQIKFVVAVGHSQGGAIAILFHEWLKFHLEHSCIRTVTFGCPRAVYFWNFKKIKDRFFGVFNYKVYKDVVPHFPPKIFGYKDVGSKNIMLGNKGLYFPTPKKMAQAHTSYEDYLGNELY